ncbi:hypothetical protein [Corynebacterium kutscheri]|uniref:Oxidoreductase n=1 Tax=Corynebacterium kutscheri TaxID=35755 RepID=A0AB38VST3_9CORY|nr:hypothetical protein [Corynebacterium kutscheri]VEH06081.1 Oxidoreductase [Corynebacterium kutscheri]
MSQSRRIAIIGAGAAGLYTADLITRCGMFDLLDLFDESPAPASIATYSRTAIHPLKNTPTRLRVIGNVPFEFIDSSTTASINLATWLEKHYDAVIIADYTTELAAHQALHHALNNSVLSTSTAQYTNADSVEKLKSMGIPVTVWHNLVHLPTGRTLAQWQQTIIQARGIPVCF